MTPPPEEKERVRKFLEERRKAYLLTFKPSDNATSSDVVLADLARFCRAHKSTGHPDPYAAARLDGRREVWLRIQQHLRLTDDELWHLFS